MCPNESRRVLQPAVGVCPSWISSSYLVLLATSLFIVVFFVIIVVDDAHLASFLAAAVAGAARLSLGGGLSLGLSLLVGIVCRDNSRTRDVSGSATQHRTGQGGVSGDIPQRYSTDKGHEDTHHAASAEQ